MVARRGVAAYHQHMGKVELRVEIDTELVAQARAAGIALDEAAEVGLRIALADAGHGRPLGAVASHLRQAADPARANERARRWVRENAEAISIHNARVAERGVFGEDLRRW
jgi:post-segregation antitoxin (ccd killing protein)